MIEKLRATWTYWRKGVRLYIAIAIGLVTLEAWWWAEATYSGSSLVAIRLEEVYAWLALGLITLAVFIGPIYSTWRKLPGNALMRDARRLCGVGGAWFASLHVSIAYIALFKRANLFDLPKNYQQAFALGTVALLILLAMAFTSFDRAMRAMGVWWFRLHRLVYVALVVTLLHAFMIGVHATHWTILIILSITALYLIGLHSYLYFIRAARPTKWQVITISLAVVSLLFVFNYGYGQRLGTEPIGGRHATVR